MSPATSHRHLGSGLVKSSSQTAEVVVGDQEQRASTVLPAPHGARTCGQYSSQLPAADPRRLPGSPDDCPTDYARARDRKEVLVGLRSSLARQPGQESHEPCTVSSGIPAEAPRIDWRAASGVDSRTADRSAGLGDKARGHDAAPFLADRLRLVVRDQGGSAVGVSTLVDVVGCPELHAEQMPGDGGGESGRVADEAGRAFLAADPGPHDDEQGDQDQECDDRCEG